jgi:hypothetical protein
MALMITSAANLLTDHRKVLRCAQDDRASAGSQWR